MGVLLRFGDAQLGHAHGAEVLAQAIFHGDTGPGHQHVGHGGVVLGVADVGGGEKLPLEAVKLRVHDGTGDLPGPVGAEVEEDDAVVVGNGAVRVADHRLHKLVGDVVFIGLGHGVHRVGILDALAIDHGVVGQLHPLPAVVPVHGVIPAHDGGDFSHAQGPALFLAIGHETLAAGGGYVPPVQKRVDIHPGQTLVPGHLQQGVQVLDVGVDAAVGQKPVQVQAGALFQAVVHGLVVGGVFKEAAVVDGPGDPGQILEHHPAAADVGVAHLAVAHLPGGQTHVQAAGGQGGVGIFGEKPVQLGRLGQAHGIAGAGVGEAEAVHDDQGSRRLVHCGTSCRFA